MRIDSVELDHPFVLAPLAGITDSPMRRLCRRLGAAMVWTEMVSAEGIIRGGEKTFDLLRFEAEERPIAFQIFGANPESMAGAAAAVARLGPDVLDVNAGCPARKVVRSGSGSGLMRDLGLLREIAAAVVEASSVPVTFKLRSGWDAESVNAVEAAKVLEGAGVAAVAVHPRTKAQGFSGSADWSVIREVVDEVGVPVIGSGDVKTPEDGLRMIEETSCEAVMIGRAAVGNPWIFSATTELARSGRVPDAPSLEEKLRLAVEHLELMVEHKGDRKGVFETRKHLVAYLKSFPGASALRAELVRIEEHDCLRARLVEAAAAARGVEGGDS
jgi:tRNA-dihydrouridine synthase B